MKINDDIKIIHEDEALLVLDKPSGLIVNRSNTTKDKTLQDFLEDYLELFSPDEASDNSEASNNSSEEPTPQQIFTRRSGLAHRLDKGTSGIILVAKDPETLRYLMSQFKTRKVKKEYIALTHGKLKDPLIEVNAPIARNPKNRFKFAVVEGGKSAKTTFRLLNFKEKYSLVQAQPKTGRTHQIRVHLSALNHPVVGDKTYAPKSSYQEDKAQFGRLMLHAKQIEIYHPLSRKKVTYATQVPTEFQKYY
ncbi:RluA family pseudouridine synthase [candidate division WWE3 bacterium]|nr:RluA family pseudouridine synthase [candidate division WWE3 bacterium]